MRHATGGVTQAAAWPAVAARALVIAFGVLVGAHLPAPSTASAQDAPIDTAAVLYDVARQLEAEGRIEQARMLYRLIRERYPGAYAAETARVRLIETTTHMAERSGGTELLVWSTLYGLWLGVAVPGSLSADGAETYGLGLLVGGPAGFLAARRYAHDRPITLGHARAITFGGIWGTWQGFGWREVLDIGEKTIHPPPGECCPYEADPSTEAVLGSMILGGLAGIAAGAAIAGSRDVSAGTAAAVNYGALWGTWYGTALGWLASLDDDDLLAAALLGGDAALVAAALIAPDLHLSVERVRLISIAGVAGGLAGAGLDLIAQPGDDKVAILIPTLTSALGLALGVHWTRDYVPSNSDDDFPGDGALIDLRDGRWSLGLPRPTPVPVREGHGQGWSPEVRFELLSARF